jgi:recombination protein RecT
MLLARRSGEIADIWAEVVYERDVYDVQLGTERRIAHRPHLGEDRGALVACYAVARMRDRTDTVFLSLTREDVMRHRASSDSADRDWSPWKKHEPEMWRKTAIHALFKWLPRGDRLDDAVRRILDSDAPAGDARALADVPLAGALSGLSTLTARLTPAGPVVEVVPEAAAPPATAVVVMREPGQDCAHAKIPPSRLTGGKVIVCPDCGEELREPGVGK